VILETRNVYRAVENATKTIVKDLDESLEKHLKDHADGLSFDLGQVRDAVSLLESGRG